MLSGVAGHQTHPIRGFASFEARNNTNQRIQFDVDESAETLYTGGTDGVVRSYHVPSGEDRGVIDCSVDVVNGISYSAVNGRRHLAVATGARHFPDDTDVDSVDSVDIDADHTEKSTPRLRLYQL